MFINRTALERIPSQYGRKTCVIWRHSLRQSGGVGVLHLMKMVIDMVIEMVMTMTKTVTMIMKMSMTIKTMTSHPVTVHTDHEWLH